MNYRGQRFSPQHIFGKGIKLGPAEKTDNMEVHETAAFYRVTSSSHYKELKAREAMGIITRQDLANELNKLIRAEMAAGRK